MKLLHQLARATLMSASQSRRKKAPVTFASVNGITNCRKKLLFLFVLAPLMFLFMERSMWVLVIRDVTHICDGRWNAGSNQHLSMCKLTRRFFCSGRICILWQSYNNSKMICTLLLVFLSTQSSKRNSDKVMSFLFTLNLLTITDS